MGCDWVYTTWLAAADGDNPASASVYLSFGPTYAIAQTALSQASGGGLCTAGFTQYTTRPDPNGGDLATNFSWDPLFGFPPDVWAEALSSVSAQLNVGGSQSGSANVTVFFLS
ncbi:MAG: hypothetical protein M3O30_18660 [Planctomycetota bacterium]|nr:hypothetical protein [Planctomycetota bacterium]